MSAPQMKERPSSKLRAMFAGFGSLMSGKDRVRSKPAAEAPADAAASAPEAAAAATETAVLETPAEPEAVAEPETAATEAVVGAEATAEPEPAAEPVMADEPESAVAETPVAETASAAAETVVPETAEEPEVPADPETGDALPLANYDELTVASLRARLRNLSNDDLTRLMGYEKEHQNRPEVVKMFQNRLIKMTTGLQKLQA